MKNGHLVKSGYSSSSSNSSTEVVRAQVGGAKEVEINSNCRGNILFIVNIRVCSILVVLSKYCYYQTEVFV